MPLQSTAPGTFAFPDFDPPTTQLLQKTGSIEILFTQPINAATATRPAIRLIDDTLGYEYDTHIVVHTSSPRSRVEVRPIQDLEFDHRMKLVVSKALKFTSGTDAGPFTATWKVKPGGHPHSFWVPEMKTLMVAREAAAAQPWARGWDDSTITGQRKRGMKNGSINSADWLAGETASAVVGAPADHNAARAAYTQFLNEMEGGVASAWGWFFTGTAAYRDKPGAFLMDWLRKFDITPKYKTDTQNYPWDAILWSLCITEACYLADMLWETGATDFGPFERGEFVHRMKKWGGIMANEWKPDLDLQTVNNICAWVNCAVGAIGAVIGDSKIRAWAYDGSDQPEGWTANARPLTYCKDNLWLSDGSYSNEAKKESKGSGQGWTYGTYAMNAYLWHLTVMGNHDYQWEWDKTNVHGNTMEVTADFYADFIDGTAMWSSRYGGNSIDPYQAWSCAQRLFGKPAHHYLSAKLRNLVTLNFGVDTSGNSMQEPFGEDHIHWCGGNLDYLPDAAAMGADVTAPNNVTSLVNATKGVSWAELTWTRAAIADEADLAKHYEIIDETGAPVTLDTTLSNGYTVQNLSPGTAYTFRVKTVDKAGNKSAGVTVAVTTDSV